MAIQKVIQFGNPLLRQVSSPVTDFEDSEIKKIELDLRDTLIDLKQRHQRGGGLAAPQIGHLNQIICLIVKGELSYMINPKILEKSQETFAVWDFCFSADASFIAEIERHKRIKVEFYTETGEKAVREYEGYWSELLQHEIDHLHGRLFIDLIKNTQKIMMKEEWDKQFSYTQT